MFKTDSGAYIDLAKTSAFYKKYVNGSNYLSIYAVVDGVDIMIKICKVGIISTAEKEADTYIETLVAERDKLINDYRNVFCAIPSELRSIAHEIEYHR